MSVYDIDPDTGLPREPVVLEPVGCPDGGTCHHECATACWRVRWVGPLSGVYPGDRWPAEVRAAAGEALEPDVDGAMITALKAIYVQVAGGKHTVSGQKAWIRALAGTALHAAGLAAGADIEWGGQVVTLWHGDIEPRLLGEPEVPERPEPE
jgi:hypothetical protein